MDRAGAARLPIGVTTAPRGELHDAATDRTGRGNAAQPALGRRGGGARRPSAAQRAAHALLGLAVATAALCGPGDARADDASAVYASISALAAIDHNDYDGWSSSTGGGFNVKVGYQWNHWLAVDLGYELAVFGLTPQFDNPDASQTDLLTHYFPVSVKLFPFGFGDEPMLGRIHPLVQFGIGPMWAQVGEKQYFEVGSGVNLENRRGMAWQAGAGVEIEASEKIRAFVEARYVAGMGSVDEVRYIGIGFGLLYRF